MHYPNDSDAVDISDAVTTLRYLFLGDQTPGCLRAMDANDDGLVDISDAAFSLGFLFLGAIGIPEPYPACGRDLEEIDGLSCQEFRPCSRS